MKIDNINYIDTHCHLDLYTDYENVITEAERNKTFIIAVTNMPSVFGRELKLFKSKNVIVSLGLHPQLVREYGHEIKLLTDLLPSTKFVGEIGLDYQVHHSGLKEKQITVFEKILNESAKFGDKVLTVHSRKSSDDVVAMIGSNFPGTIILHWYSGSMSTLKKAITSGYLFSVNPAMIVSKSGQNIIKELPLERILTETDGPFTQLNKRITIPSDVHVVTDYLARLHGKTNGEVAEMVKSNFSKLFIK